VRQFLIRPLSKDDYVLSERAATRVEGDDSYELPSYCSRNEKIIKMRILRYYSHSADLLRVSFTTLSPHEKNMSLSVSLRICRKIYYCRYKTFACVQLSLTFQGAAVMNK